MTSLHSGGQADVAQLVEHFTRNEGVRGSNPRVGSLKAPLSGVFVCRLADALAAGSHLGHTRVVLRACLADEFFRGDGFGVFEFVEDVRGGVDPPV